MFSHNLYIVLTISALQLSILILIQKTVLTVMTTDGTCDICLWRRKTIFLAFSSFISFWNIFVCLFFALHTLWLVLSNVLNLGTEWVMLLMMEGLKRKDGVVDWIELPSHERIIIFSSTVSHTERGKLGNFYQRFPPSKVLYPVLFVVTLRPVSLILSCRRRKGGKKRWQRRKNARMQKPKRQHKLKNCTLPQSLWSWLGNGG